MMDTERAAIRNEFRSFHVTRETDHGILDSGIWAGQRFITTVTGCGDSWEEAEQDLERGGTITGYECRAEEG
jgi:hypothetical protein